MNYTRTLAVHTLDSPINVRLPEAEDLLSMDASALELMTDFHHNVPPMIEASTSVDEADELMQREHCTYKIVIDHAEQLRGIVTLLDIHSSLTLAASNATGLNRTELPVTEIMVPVEQLHGIAYSRLARAQVRDLVETMKTLSERFLLVLDDDSGRLRGLVSSRVLSRRLALPNMPFRPAQTISEIQAALGHH